MVLNLWLLVMSHPLHSMEDLKDVIDVLMGM